MNFSFKVEKKQGAILSARPANPNMGNSNTTMVSEEERRRNIKQMDQQMNLRFGRTSKHKLNIVVRGERSTGKTMLTKLLCGGVFDIKYIPSKAGETERFCVPWAAGAGEDVDLSLTAYTDTEKKRDNEATNSLKIAHEEKNRFSSKQNKQKQNEDSKIYESCNGVIVMVNPTKEWTFSYAKDILEGIPESIEVLVLANFRDCMDQWVTTRASMQEHVAGCGRHVHYCDCCLANMFGMPAVEAFLRICLFTIKIEEFKRQAEAAGNDVESALADLERAGAAQDYSAYVPSLAETLPEESAASRSTAPAPAAAAPSAAASVTDAGRPLSSTAESKHADRGGKSATATGGDAAGGDSKSGSERSKAQRGRGGQKEAPEASPPPPPPPAEGGRDDAGFYSEEDAPPPPPPPPAAATKGKAKAKSGRRKAASSDDDSDQDSDESPPPAKAKASSTGKKKAGGGGGGSGGSSKPKGNALAFWDDEDVDDEPPPARPTPTPSPSAGRGGGLKIGTPPAWAEPPSPADKRRGGDAPAEHKKDRDREKSRRRKDDR